MIYNLHFTSFHTYTTCAHNSSHHVTDTIYNAVYPSTSQQYVCNHIIVVCMLLKHSFVLVCQLLQVNLSMFITCCVADVYWQYCVCWCIVMCGCACNARPCPSSSKTRIVACVCKLVVCACWLISVCLAFVMCVLCNVLWAVYSSRSAQGVLQGQQKKWGCKLQP